MVSLAEGGEKVGVRGRVSGEKEKKKTKKKKKKDESLFFLFFFFSYVSLFRPLSLRCSPLSSHSSWATSSRLSYSPLREAARSKASAKRRQSETFFEEKKTPSTTF